MHLKNFAWTLLFCGVFQYAVGTGILLNALKNSLQNTRCNFHNIGSKIIHHDHYGDPCAQPELSHENNEYGSVGHGHNNFGSNSYGNNKFGSQNSYQVTENVYEDSHGYGNKQNLFEETQQLQHNNNGNSFGSLNEEDHSSFGYASTTSRYQLTVNNDKNKISKDTSNNGLGDEANSSKYGYYSSVDNFLPEVSSNNYKTSTSKPSSNKNQTMENIIFNNVDDQQTRQKPAITTENDPISYNIDIRGGPREELPTTIKTYEPVPSEGGRNIFKVSCPPGTTATGDGECLYEI